MQNRGHVGARRLIVLLAACLLAGSVVATSGADAAASEPTAVVSLVDTGINPYHVVFRDDSPRARQHPSTYIPGFPKDAKALPISLGERDYMSAVKKDCKLWESVKPGELYWFPGTKIVGATTFEEFRDFDCANSSFTSGHILDGNGHGTMVASRAAGNGYGACPQCRIVAIQGFSTASVKWAAQNADWIDAQSNSWGPFLPLWTPVDTPLIPLWSSPSFVKTVEEAAAKHLAFWASGNGAGTRGGVLGHPTLLDPRMTPSIVMVGGHDSGYVNLWPDFPPHVVSDSCNSWAAYRDKINESDDNVGGGTSGATPYAAGQAARVLLEARKMLFATGTGVEKGVAATGDAGVTKGPLADGRFTLKEWKEVLFKTASARPKRQKEDGSVCDAVAGLVLYSSTPVKWEDVPEDYPEYLHIGYGATDDAALQLALQVLTGGKPLPDRSDTDAYFEADGQVRGALHDIFRGP